MLKAARCIFWMLTFCLVIAGEMAGAQGDGIDPNDRSGSSNTSVPSGTEAKLKTIQAALNTTPRPAGVAEDKVFFDLEIKGCDTIASFAEQYIQDTSFKKRAVALTISVAFVGATDPKKATIPLFALANFGDTKLPEIKCNEAILKGVPKTQAINVSVDLTYSSEFDTAVIGSVLNEIGTALIGVSYLGPHTATAGMTVFGFAKGIDAVSKSAVKFLDLIAPKKIRFRHVYTFDAKTLDLRYGPKTTPVLVLHKNMKNSSLPEGYSDANPDTISQAFTQQYGEQKALSIVFGRQAVTEPLARVTTTPNAQNLASLCEGLRSEVDRTYNGDSGAIALAVYYYMYQKQDIFRPFKATCLTTPHVEILAKLGIKKSIYPGSLDPSIAIKSPEQGGEDQGVPDATFQKTKDRLDALATQLKNMPSKDSIAHLKTLFASELALAGEGVKLLPRVEGLPRDETIDKIKEWGDKPTVAHFGCYGKPKDTLSLKRNVTGEALALFPDKKLLALVKVGLNKEDKIERLEFSKADIDAVTRLMDKREECGAAEYGWNPRKDFDTFNTGPINVSSR